MSVNRLKIYEFCCDICFKKAVILAPTRDDARKKVKAEEKWRSIPPKNGWDKGQDFCPEHADYAG
jgi:hypothetical protein